MFSQVFIRSTTWRLNSTVCRRHFAILAILPPFDAKCVYSPCLTFGVQSTRPNWLSAFSGLHRRLIMFLAFPALEHIPQELIVDFVVILHFRRLHEGPQ